MFSRCAYALTVEMDDAARAIEMHGQQRGMQCRDSGCICSQ